MSARRLAVVPAAGSGSRFGQALPKQYTLLAGQPPQLLTAFAGR